MFRVGLIGCGRQGWRRARAVRDNCDDLAIVADVDRAKCEALAREISCRDTNDWKEVTEEEALDVIIICTPNHLHLPMSVAAMLNGKHVLCEKPLARTPQEAEEIVMVARDTGMKLKCGFNLRHHPAVRLARSWFESGMIGEIMFIRIRYGICGREGYDREWRADRNIAGGGQLMDQGVHALDLSRWFLGEFSEVFGYTPTVFWKNSQVEDNAFCLLRTEKNQMASIHVSWTQWKNMFSLEIYGDEGYVAVEGLGGAYGTERAVLGRVDFVGPFEEKIVEFRGEDLSWLEDWREFVSAIKGKREPLGNGQDGLEAVRLAYAIYESAAKGCPVRLSAI